MRILMAGLGIQGTKRSKLLGEQVTVTVDPNVPSADFRTIDSVPLDQYDAAYLCIPDGEKVALIKWLLEHKKPVLVEKPLLFESPTEAQEIQRLAEVHQVACYTAYNHRFEPHFVRMKETIQSGVLGDLYGLSMWYGNGTARDVRNSEWRDAGLGVLSDIGSHLLDSIFFMLGERCPALHAWDLRAVENKAYDWVCLGTGPGARPHIQLEATLLSWRNTFRMEVIGSKGSAHIEGLCKWGPSVFTLRTRKLPSGRPDEQVWTEPQGDPTWELEHRHFADIAYSSFTHVSTDEWIQAELERIESEAIQA